MLDDTLSLPSDMVNANLCMLDGRSAAAPGPSTPKGAGTEAAEERRCRCEASWSGDARLRGEAALPRLRWLLMRCSSMWCTGISSKWPWCVPRFSVAPATPSSAQPKQEACRRVRCDGSIQHTGCHQATCGKKTALRPFLEARMRSDSPGGPPCTRAPSAGRRLWPCLIL